MRTASLAANWQTALRHSSGDLHQSLETTCEPASSVGARFCFTEFLEGASGCIDARLSECDSTGSQAGLASAIGPLARHQRDAQHAFVLIDLCGENPHGTPVPINL